MIRVAIVDDHHAVRLGLHTAIRSEPGLVPAGTSPGSERIAVCSPRRTAWWSSTTATRITRRPGCHDASNHGP